MLDNKFRIKIEMLSDWQIGTGAGIPGSVDELISKDADGFPQVPAKTIVGIWRDALERLCDGLGGNWSVQTEKIFGVQPNLIKNDELKARLADGELTFSKAILSLQPARISENLRAKIREDKRLKQALTFIKVGVKIDEESGTSSTDMLRFEEMGRIGTILETEVECEKMNKTISALLILSAKLVDRIGGKRRRGAGRCKLTIDGITDKDVSDAVETIRNNHTSPDKKPEKKQISFSQSSSDWQTCEYTLTLETPVSIVTAVLGNVSETLDFVPGTYLISHFGQQIFAEILKGNFQISPATVCIDGKRSFPVPKVFAQEKMNKSKVYNRLKEKLTKEIPQTKPIREGFISDLSSGDVKHATTPQMILMHNAIHDPVQRPTEEVVGVYSREAIQAGTILKGEIRYRNLEIDLKELNGKIRIGTSKKDDYGLAKIEFEESKPFYSISVLNSAQLVVYLASDAMLRNGNLRQTNLICDLKNELEKFLGKGKLKSYDELLKEAEIKREANPNDEEAERFIESRKDKINSIVHVRRIESWQTSWGLPRPTLTLMQAGSVVVFEIRNFDRLTEDEKSEFEENLKKIEAEGIGERRGEGYGQIIFNPSVLETRSNDKTNKLVWENKDAEQYKLVGNGGEIEDKEFAKLIEETAWREEIKIAVSKIAAEKNLRKEIFGLEIERNQNGEVKKSAPPMSQIGGLRSAVMRLQIFEDDKKKIGDKTLVIDWLEHLKTTKNRVEKWNINKNADKAKKMIDEKIIPLFKNLEKVWLILCETKIDGVNVWKSPELLVQSKGVLQGKLWAEAVKSLFYACQMAHKRDLEKIVKEEKANGTSD